MRTDAFDYPLPPHLIAQSPAARRDASRLFQLNRTTQTFTHTQFTRLPSLLPDRSLVILNNSKVIPARLFAQNPITGGRFEMLLLEEAAPLQWWAMMRPGKRATPGKKLKLIHSTQNASHVSVEVLDTNDEGHRLLQFSGTTDILKTLEEFGELPLPPYIERNSAQPFSELDRERYQTVYASAPGSIAAPTAGLHFTESIFESMRSREMEIHTVTLHVGAGTFAPVKTTELQDHRMHCESYEVPETAAKAIRKAKEEGRTIVAVGTTSLRVLESAADPQCVVKSGRGTTRLFVYPPYAFQVVDQLITNFHLPQSTLLMLISAFASPGKTEGRELILRAYQEAIQHQYRFFSYGDAMLIQ